jgi:hypothetical protein
MAFFTNVFTVDTWEQAAGRNFTVTGFPPPTPGRRGYFDSTFDKVKVADTLVCYVVAPAKRWVGALRVEGPMFLDYDDPVWGTDDSGMAAFPARLKVSPIVARPVELGVPVEETIGLLGCLDAKNWSGLFRRSLKPVPEADGKKIVELLLSERAPSPVRMPRKRVRRPKRVEPEVDAVEVVEPTAQPRPHLELMTKLVSLGRTLGCDVWGRGSERPVRVRLVLGR